MTTPPTNAHDPSQVSPATPRIVLGVTGGVAAYKTAELTRLLVKAGVDVTVVMTPAAQQFVTPVTLQALSGNKVFTDMWDADVPNNMAHIELTRSARLVVIAPATADFLAKLAQGHANDLLSTLCLARDAHRCPLLVAPAMNREMWDNPATQRNVAQLREDGIGILGPAAGEQACGETGMGRMVEPEVLLEAILEQLKPIDTPMRQSFRGKRALVTAGPTFEALDPVRGITNRSSGKMGYAIAAALLDAGADVTLVSGPTSLTPPRGLKTLGVESASQMLAAVEDNLADVDVFFAVAAVADYAPKAPASQKMKKSSADLALHLVPTVDILAKVASRPKPPFCVGFAAESENVVEYASKKRQKKSIPMIVANHANSAIGADQNEVTIIDDAGEHPLPRGPKELVAKQIVAHAARLMHQAADRGASMASVTSLNRPHQPLPKRPNVAP
jgi:phosphopantothenoylcysteine decarboxylase/phosphopantothenate--cysteine ligase